MSDLILPEAYLLMTVIIVRLEVELYEIPHYKFIKRLLLKSRIEDHYSSRSILEEVEFLRGDKLYANIPADSLIIEYLYSNGIIELYEKVVYKKVYAIKKITAQKTI